MSTMKEANRIVSTVVPMALMGAVGYSSWVFCGSLCTNYLIKERHRTGLATGLLTGYGILFALFIAPYLRTFLTIQMAPGYIERGSKLEGDAARRHDRPKRKKQWHLSSKSTALKAAQREADLEKGKRRGGVGAGPMLNGGMGGDGTPDSPAARSAYARGAAASTSASGAESTQSTQATPYTPGPMSHNMMGGGQHVPGPPVQEVSVQSPHHGAVRPDSTEDDKKPRNLKQFWTRDVFICEPDGLPRWCPHCNIWKPDRTHHCSEVERCVRRMDHICPWVGGVVGETSYKFFVQTLFYASFYTIYMLTCLAIFIKEKIEYDGKPPNDWLGIMILSAAFAFFSCGMCASTLQLMSKNVSTIENLSVRTKEYYLAIYDPSLSSQPQGPEPNPESPNQGWVPKAVSQITFPLPRSHPLSDSKDCRQSVKSRTFRVIRTEAGENPWRLRSTYDNFAEVLGYALWEWWLPLTRSPVEKRGWSRFNQAIVERVMYPDKTGTHEDV